MCGAAENHGSKCGTTTKTNALTHEQPEELTNLAVTSWQYLLAICSACCWSARRMGRAAGAMRGPVWATSGDSEPKGDMVVKNIARLCKTKHGRKKWARGAVRYRLSSRSTCTNAELHKYIVQTVVNLRHVCHRKRSENMQLVMTKWKTCQRK